MQEGLFSLMQMAKTTAALTQLTTRKLPFITVLTDRPWWSVGKLCHDR